MNYFNIKITPRSGSPEYIFELEENLLKTRVLRPYESGIPIVNAGRTIRADELERVEIHEVALDGFQRLFSSNPPQISQASKEEKFLKGKDVTDKYIRYPPGYASTVEINKLMDQKKVFVVHGHDENMKDQLHIFLSENKLDPVVLHRKPDGGQTLIEKFEKHAKEAGFAFILLTPDDIGYPIAGDAEPDGRRVKERRARQNVIFEFGYFVARLGRNRVCCLYKPDVMLPTDIAGLLYKKVTGKVEEIGYELLKELRAAGYKV